MKNSEQQYRIEIGIHVNGAKFQYLLCLIETDRPIFSKQQIKFGESLLPLNPEYFFPIS
jgi:hypothetical protein